jgi:eukaryotic-like serine/threonine-protein kinase
MDAARWQELSGLLDELLELPPPLRARRLAQLGRQDRRLADELRALVELDAGTSELLPTAPAPRVAPPVHRIGPYRLEQQLGAGAMGEVWRALRDGDSSPAAVAIKFVHDGSEQASMQQRLVRERQALERLAHPNIVALLDAGIAVDGRRYLVLEHVDGTTLAHYCQQLRPDLAMRLQVFVQVCEAIAHAHACGVLHCDLKPANILVDRRGQVRVVDFGVAVLRDQASCYDDEVDDGAGFSLHYTAPERLCGGAADEHTDVYALGVVLYELITGEKPYHLRRQADADWGRALLAMEPVPPSRRLATRRDDGAARMAVSATLDAIVLRAMHKQPGQRHPSVQALAAELRSQLRPASRRSQRLRAWLTALLRPGARRGTH